MSQDLIQEMKRKVEAYWASMKEQSPFQQALSKGSLTPQWVQGFLVNVHYLVQHTPAHLHLAILMAEHRNETALRDFFVVKYEEELGHDEWAKADLSKLKVQLPQDFSTAEIDPAMIQLVNSIESLIERDPFLYLPYIFFAEYLCVIAGPEMSTNIVEKCGYPPGSLSIVENHAELDIEHVDEWEEVIHDLVDTDQYAATFMTVLDECMAHHKRYFWTCGLGEQHHDAA